VTAWEQLRLNPRGPLPAGRGLPRLHGIEPHEGPMWVTGRLGRACATRWCSAPPRVAQTRLAELSYNPGHPRKVNGEHEVVIVFGFAKGDCGPVEKDYVEAQRAGRAGILLLHLWLPDIRARYNAAGPLRAGISEAPRASRPALRRANSAGVSRNLPGVS